MDFDRLPDQKDLTKRRAAFDTGDVNARGEPGKWAAPSRTPCRNNLARWRVTQAQTLSTRTAYDGRHTFPSAIVVNTNPGPRSCALQILPLPARRQCADARHSSSRPIENSSPAGRRMCAPRLPTISGNPPVNIGRHPHFGRCHCPTVSLRLTTGHRGRMASEQAGRPAIPSRNQHMPTQSTDTASAYDGVRCVR